MAANFGDTIMEGGIEPSVRVQAPVEAPAPDRSSEVLANGLAPVFNTLGAMAGTIFKQNQEDASTKILANYETDLLDLADAVDQGAMTRDEAMLQARVLRRQYMGNAPALQKDFDTVWTDFASASGLGHVVVTGTIEEQARDARTQEAIKLGYTPEEYELFQTRSQEAVALNREVEILTARGQIPTLTQKNKYTNVVIGLAESAFPAAQTQINKAMADIAANPGAKIEVAEQLNLSLGQSIEQLRAMSGPMDAAYITTPIEGLLKTFNDWTNNTVSTAILENEIKATKAKYEAMYVNDPTLGPVIAASAILGDLGLANTSVSNAMFSPEFLQRLKEVTEGKPVNVFGAEAGDNLFTEGIRQVAGTLTPDSPQEVIDEVMSSLNSMIDGAYVFERSASQDELGYKNVVEVLGSPEAANAIKLGGGITAQHANKFTGILKENYEQVLLPAVSEYWQSVPLQNPVAGERVVPNNTPMSELLKPVWNGSAVEFIPNEAYANDPRVISLATDVNTGRNSIGIPLNNLINAYANVSQTDAKSIWEQDFAGRVFGLGPDGEPTIASRVDAALNEPTAAPEDGFTIAKFQPESEEEIEQFTTQSSAITENAELPPIDPAYTDVEGIDYSSYLPSIRTSESGGNDSAKNPGSTALGRYQFLRSTWNALANRYPNSGITPDGRTDPNQQEIAIRLFTAENARYLKARGIPLSNGTLYAAHFLGASDAVKVLNADGSTPISSLVSRSVINANKFLSGMTVSKFRAWAYRKGNA